MNPNSHTADALREILATCADPLNRACEEYAKLERKLAEAQDIAAELITERARRSFEDRMSAASETRRTYEDGLNAVQRELDLVAVEYENEESLIQHLTDRISALKKADPQPQVDATVESDAPQGGQGGYKAVGSAPRNIEGPAHLCPKPAPGFELDKRGVLVATDRGPSAPCVARPSEEAVLMAQTAIERFGSRRFDKLTLDQADQLRMAREILRLDERNGA